MHGTYLMTPYCSTEAHFSVAFTPAFTTASPWTTGLGKKHFGSGSGHMHISMGNWSWSTVSKALRPCTSFDLFSAVPGLMVPHGWRSRWLFLPHINSNVLPSLLPAICQGSTSRVDWLAASQLLEDLKGIYYIFLVIAYSLEEFYTSVFPNILFISRVHKTWFPRFDYPYTMISILCTYMHCGICLNLAFHLQLHCTCKPVRMYMRRELLI